jgi:hypothetical protein
VVDAGGSDYLQPAGVIVLPGGQAGFATGLAGAGGDGLTAAVAGGFGLAGWCNNGH